MSGESNVIYWLKNNGYEPQRPLVEAIFAKAKSMNRNLSEEEIRAVIHSVSGH